MAARKKRPVDETTETTAQTLATVAAESGEEAAEAAAAEATENVENAETDTATTQAPIHIDVASVQALAFPYNRTLKYGADGEDVRALQKALLSCGLDVMVSGVYDLRTVRAVQQLQRQKGQPPAASSANTTIPRCWAAINQLKGALSDGL